MKQITKKQALEIANSKIYETWSDYEKVKFQLFQERLSIPFDIFHEAITNILKRPVYTHEFASSNIEKIRAEFLGEKDAPTFNEILDLIPAERRIVISNNKE